MNIFKKIMNVVCRFGTFGLGFGIGELATGDYKSAAWVLFAVSIIFMVGWFVEGE